MGARLSYSEADLAGKVAVVTGGNTGIGYETAKALSVMGAHTIIACRSQEKAAGAIARMKEEVEREHLDRQITVEFLPLDLASFQSVKEFTLAFREKNLPLHFLINNAGIFAVPLSKTGDGYESQFQVNHLSPFLLTLELLPIILTTASACGDCRIVFVSSSGHGVIHWEPANINAELSYSRLKFYYFSKLYNVMSGYALQRRLQDVGVTVSSLNPGLVDTEIFRNVSDHGMLNFMFGRVANVVKRTPKKGAATTINCAVNPQLNSQQCFYYDSCAPKRPSSDSRNEPFQEELWKRSVDIVKEFLSPEALERYGHSSSEQGEQREEEEEEGERRAEEGGEVTERQEEQRGEGQEEVKREVAEQGRVEVEDQH